MKHFLVTLEYDGTDFAGWQKQPGRRTVQGELEKALHLITGRETPVTGAGRTDRGVHATGQAASFSMENWKSAPEVLATALNAKLPLDVAVTRVWETPKWFSARQDAVSRTYQYAFLLSPVRQPLAERYAFRVEKSPDYNAMKKAASLFRGTHDFCSFAREPEGGKWTRRTITRCALSRHGRFIFLDVQSGGFLRHMVRNMAAAVLGVGLGVIKPGVIRKALAMPSNRPPLAMLPPHGLTLTQVRFTGLKMRQPGGRAKVK